jgi:hypothetical protein
MKRINVSTINEALKIDGDEWIEDDEIMTGDTSYAPCCAWLPRTKEWIVNQQLGRKGYRHSEETKQKIKNSLLGMKHTEERKRNNSIGSCKYQYTITNPDGEVFYETNMKAFCMNRDIDAGAMTRVAQGKQRAHKGWRCAIIREKATTSQ